ncbi:uncharacterized protein Z518_02629 [Rhinocladiella mackenziei CBS 650.93]|uniref:Zn(II)2Cys6 transcription factor n=1 Tax=Rhinocladiella mackenziei CBS 650.93 TaxID=1442369 RepID=A0A0D2JFF6_9EURO|nr:uncharacterized protein Z518_02629 [Rhinocladiella mackenziei CBS 650.93]KIX07975.1 hypothetical protein Z518_02629 [Rhinocladiella mackenziei CBS 650.93]
MEAIQREQIRRRAQYVIQSPRRTHLGGYRLDPFISYPIPATSCVQHTVDYFVQTWAHQQPSIYHNSRYQNELIELLFPFALQHDLLFESLISVVRASRLLIQGANPASDKVFLHHRGMALSKLHDRVGSPDKFCDDAAMMTVGILLTIDYIMSDWSSVGVHYAALQYMARIRGPVENGGDMYDMIRVNMTGYEGIAAHGKAQLAATRSPVEEPQLEYPRHPFSAELCITIAKIPQGFSELALGGSLSTPMINLLAKISTATGYSSDKDAPSKVERNITYNLSDVTNEINLLSPLPLRPFEKKLCYGLVSYCWTFHMAKALSALFRSVVQDAVDTFIAQHDKVIRDISERYCVIWLAFAITGAGQQCERPAENVDQVLDLMLKTYKEMREWEQLQEILHLFFWEDELGARWKAYWESAMVRFILPEI